MKPFISLPISRWMVLGCLFSFARTAVAAPVNYEREVAPILRAYCAGCHNDADHEGKLSVEMYSRLRQGGEDQGDPIHPGQPDQSFLIRAIEGLAKPHMPPKDEPQVPSSERDVLRRWVAEGAPGPVHDESILAHLVVPRIATGKNVRRPVTAVAYSPLEGRLAVARSKRIELVSVLSSEPRTLIEGLPGKINAIHFSRDGRRLLVASGIPGLRGVASVWDLQQAKWIGEFGGHTDLLGDARFSPDGRLIATAGYDRTLRIWDAESGRCLHTNAVHNGAIFSLAFDPTGTVLASASADQTVKLWRVSDGLRLDTLNQAQGELNAVVFTPDGTHILAAGADRRIYLWRFLSTNGPASNPLLAARFAHDAAVTAMAVSSDGHFLVSASADRTLKQWSLPDLLEVKAWPSRADIVAALSFDPVLPRFVAGSLDGSTEVLELADNPYRPESLPASAEAVAPPLTGKTTALEVTESEPNDRPENANPVEWPVNLHGNIGHPGDADLFRFHARPGQPLTLAIHAAAAGSWLDSRLEVLTPEGRPVPRVQLQAIRDSWFTFRGKDSDTSDDFRLQNWAQMELDEYLYANGEVVKLWLYPRGPDSGFKVYPGEGRRQPALGTTALVHAVNEPCYIVRPLPPGATVVPNGLPVFQLYYENDDDPSRLVDADSRLSFMAPADGDYLVRVTDIRGFGGASHYDYTLEVREVKPDFTVKLENPDPKVSPGSARELRFVATRREDFEGAIRITLENLPTGFRVSAPIEIEAGQIRATATLSAAPGTPSPETNATSLVQIKAFAMINGVEVVHSVGTLGRLTMGEPPKVMVSIVPGTDRSYVKEQAGQPLEFEIRPGQTISAKVRVVRHDFEGRIEFGNEDSGRNLPHGLYVDNIGLNGLLIVEGQIEREFFITAAPKARPGTRLFHLRTTADGGQCSPDAIIHVLPGLQAAGQ